MEFKEYLAKQNLVENHSIGRVGSKWHAVIHNPFNTFYDAVILYGRSGPAPIHRIEKQFNKWKKEALRNGTEI